MSSAPNLNEPYTQQDFNHSMRREDNTMNGYSSSSTQLPTTLTTRQNSPGVGNSNGEITFIHQFQELRQSSSQQQQQKYPDLEQNSHLYGAYELTSASKNQQNQEEHVSPTGDYTYKHDQHHQQQNPIMLDNWDKASNMNDSFLQQLNSDLISREDNIMSGYSANYSTLLPTCLIDGEVGQSPSSLGYDHGLASIGPMHPTTHQSKCLNRFYLFTFFGLISLIF